MYPLMHAVHGDRSCMHEGFSAAHEHRSSLHSSFSHAHATKSRVNESISRLHAATARVNESIFRMHTTISCVQMSMSAARTGDRHLPPLGSSRADRRRAGVTWGEVSLEEGAAG